MEKRYKSIHLSEAKVGDEVYSVLRGWGEVIWVGYGGITINIKYNPIQAYNKHTGKMYADDINPELTEARREVKMVQRERFARWDSKGMHPTYHTFPTKEDAIAYPCDKDYSKTCRITWEEEEC